MKCHFKESLAIWMASLDETCTDRTLSWGGHSLVYCTARLSTLSDNWDESLALKITYLQYQISQIIGNCIGILMFQPYFSPG